MPAHPEGMSSARLQCDFGSIYGLHPKTHMITTFGTWLIFEGVR